MLLRCLCNVLKLIVCLASLAPGLATLAVMLGNRVSSSLMPLPAKLGATLRTPLTLSIAPSSAAAFA